jgi:dihydrodipicolinate synthase/N-acetylneuraminate lyase
MITPFDERGEIDWPGVARLLAHNEAEGMTGVVVAGTNGEGPSLSAVERRDLVRFAVQHAGRLQIIAGLATCSLSEAIWLSCQAEKAGAVASLALPPFYFRSAEEDGIANWFEGLFASTDLPCILYSFPKMTGIAFSEGLASRLLQNERVAGIKDSSGDEETVRMFLRIAAQHSKAALVGDERLLKKTLDAGGRGTISGLANSFPSLVARQATENSAVLQTLIDEAVSQIKVHPTPAVHKFVLSHRGLPGGGLRAPLMPLSTKAEQEVSAFVDGFGF